MVSNSAVCFDIFTAYPVRDYLPGVNGNVGVGGIVLGLVYFFNAMITLYWIKQQQRRAQRGMEGAAKHVIFPIYLPFLWFSALSDSIVGIVIFFYDINYIGANSWNAAGAAGAIFALQHFVIEGTAFALMQYGCGFIAAKNAAIWAFGWGITTFIVQFIVYRDGETKTSFYVNITWNIVLLLFYFSLWYLPDKYIFRRPSVIFYARYWVLIRVIVIISLIMINSGNHHSVVELVGNCFSVVGALLLFMCFKPYVVYKALLMDSKWWQGVAKSNNGGRMRLTKAAKQTFASAFKRALLSTGLRSSGGTAHEQTKYEQVDGHDSHNDQDATVNTLMQSSGVDDSSRGFSGSRNPALLPFQPVSPSKYSRKKHNNLRDPLDGLEVGFKDAQELAREVDYISTSSVKLLNFAYLSLDNKATLLGAGSFSKVYAGKYKTIPVAIKMLFTQDLNPDVVKRCGNEARILTDVSPHPNVVNIYGVAVLPPSVCLVLEICEYGSLSDVLRGMNAGGVTRSPLSLSYADRMYLARGCARGLQALHHYSPDLCHRDIKSMNFLIDGQLNAKICDLELGGIRDQHHRLNSDVTPTDLSSRGQNQKVTEYGENMNITWQAPEVLLGQEYTQKSDIYSLSLVLWEIIATARSSKFSSSGSGRHSGSGGSVNKSPGRNSSGSGSSSSSLKVSTNAVCLTPYSECKTQLEIREKVIRGFRPNIPLPWKDNYNTTNRDSESSVTSNSSSGSGYGNSFTNNGELDPLYIDTISTGWQPDPYSRPDIDQIVKNLNRCWLNSVHKSIYETEFIIDIETIQEENLKLTLLRDFKASSSGNSSILSRNSGGILLGHTLARAPPSAAVMQTLSVMQSELNWSSLEDDNVSYLVVSAQAPHFILWATKKFTQITGFLVNDVIAYDLDILYGPLTNQQAMNELLSSVVYGNAEHVVTSIYRRDNRPVTTSVHMFPIYDSSRTDFLDTGYMSVDSSPATSHAVYIPGKLSFSARNDPEAGAAQRGKVSDIAALLQANTMITEKNKVNPNVYKTATATGVVGSGIGAGNLGFNNTIQRASFSSANAPSTVTTVQLAATKASTDNSLPHPDHSDATEKDSLLSGSGAEMHSGLSTEALLAQQQTYHSSTNMVTNTNTNTNTNSSTIHSSNTAHNNTSNNTNNNNSNNAHPSMFENITSSIINMSPFHSHTKDAKNLNINTSLHRDTSGGSGGSHNNHNQPISSSKLASAHYRRVAYIAIQFSTVNDKP